MGIQINGQTDTITATDGSFTIQGASGNLTGDLVGNVTGNVTGNLTGTASTATAAATAYGISGSPTLSGITSVSTTNLTVNGNAYPTAGPLSNRNRIINGDMRIDQRNAGASVSFTNSSGYSVDRCFCMLQGGATGTLTFQRDTVAPAGFTNSIKATVSTADTTDTQAYIGQFVEGYNVADLHFGTANARTVTLSFWVRSSIAGTYCGGITGGGNDGNQVGYVFEYSINSANTWEYKTVTIPGETSGTYTFNSTTGTGFRVKFDLGTKGATFVAAPNAWTNGLKYSSTTAGVVRWKETLNATFYLTGVQLEVGTVATPFEHRSFGDELLRCQRYYEKSYAIGTVPGTSTSSGRVLCNSGIEGNNLLSDHIMFRAQKRITPGFSYWRENGTAGSWNFSSQNYGGTAAPSTVNASDGSFQVAFGLGGSLDNWKSGQCYGHWAASAELA